MKEKPSATSKQQNKRSSGIVSGEEGTHGQWVSGKWARSLVAGLVLLLLLLAAAFYVPRSNNTNYAQPATHFNRDATGPCSIMGDCEIVCKYINSGTIEPGHVAADFVMSDQSQCGDKLEVASLKIEGCTFPNSKLSVGWLPLKKTIKHLTILNSTFSTIEDGAFSNLFFTNEARLTIDTFSVQWLNKGMLEGVKGMKALELRVNDFLESVEENFLEPVASSLKTIQIENMGKISNLTIKNITGSTTYLVNVEELVIRYNLYIDHLGPNIFLRMPLLKSLDLTRNGIKSIDPNAFLSIRNSIELINLMGNSLSTLTQGIFDGLTLALHRKMWFRIYLRDNPWNCNCSLLWLQDMMRQQNETFRDNPLCDTPTNLYQQPLRDAAICVDETSPSPITTSHIPTTNAPTDTTVTSNTEQTTTETTNTAQPTTDSSTSEQTTTDSTSTEQTTTGSISTEQPPTDSSTSEQTTTDSPTTEQTTTDSSTTDHSSTDTSTNEQPSTTTTEQPTTEKPNNGTITVECIDLSLPKNLSQTRKLSVEKSNTYTSALVHNMPARRRLMASMTFTQVDFKVSEVDDGVVVAYIGNTTGTLIRIDSELTLNYSCYTNATGTVTYRNLQPSSSYTFCLLTEESAEVYEYNCRALRTLPIPKERTWLALEDRFVVLGVGVAVMLVCGLVCSAIVFVTVRRHPALLKGSKRVVVVQHRAVDVMVLPKQHKHTTTSTSSYRSKEQQIYSTDSSYRRTYAHSISQTSTITGRSSSTSYVSAVEPTQGQLLQWRIEQMRAKVKRFFNEDSLTVSTDNPPPLPPHPLRRQSSTSYIHRQSNETCYSSFSE